MISLKKIRSGLTVLLALMVIMAAMPLGGGVAQASGASVKDQEQANGSGNVFANQTYPRNQTFTPSYAGTLDRIELNLAGAYGAIGALHVELYALSNPSVIVASAQMNGADTGWVAIDFSSSAPYLKRNNTYRMKVYTDGASPNGVGWYTLGGDPYPRGSSDAAGYDQSFRTYMIPDYSLSPLESAITAAAPSIVADGSSQTTITVTAKDAQGTALTTGGETVVITSTAGTVGAVTDNGNGTYSATLTSPTTAGTATVGASIGGVAMSATTSVQFMPGPPSAANSTIATSASSLTADGASQATITVKLKDGNGNALTSGLSAVTISSTAGTVGPVTDNNNGTYTAMLTSSTAVGTATVGAAVGGVPLTSTASVQFVPGTPSASQSTIAALDSSLEANGTSSTTITVSLKDANGNALTSGGAAVTIGSTSGSVGTVTDNGNGTYKATLTSPTTAGTATVSAKVGGIALASTTSVQFVPGAATASQSTIAALDTSLVANGTSSTTITVSLKDANGNALTSGGSAVTIASTSGSVGTVTDNGNGTYKATLTSPTTAGTATVSAKVGGIALATTTSVQFVPGAATASQSTIAALDTSLVANGTSSTTITVSLMDANGNALTSGGAAVTIASTSGSVGTVTDNGNGTYKATLTSPTIAGTATVSAKVGGTALASTTSVEFVPGAPSASQSTIVALDTSLVANGNSSTTITVSLKDANGNALTSGGASVTIASTIGTVGTVTDNVNGTYKATLTSPTTAGTATVSAKVGGIALTSTTSVQFVPGAPSTSNSTIAVDDTSLTADGTSQTTITVKIIDANGNALTSGGAAVTISSTTGSVGTVTDNGNGTYKATLTSPTTVGTATVSAKIGGTALASPTTVEFVPGAPSAANSTIAVDDTFLTADGTSQTTITVKLIDANGNALTTGGAAVTISSTTGSVGTVTDNGNGTYKATLTSPTTAGIATVSAKVGGTELESTTSVQFVPGAPSAATSTIEIDDSSLTADGTSQTTITVKLKDANGNALTIGGATVTIASTVGIVSAVTDSGNGTYIATLTSPTTAGIATVSAKVGGTALPTPTSVEFVPGAPSEATSTIAVEDTSLTADGTSQSTITVKLKDANGNALTSGGAAVTITSTAGSVGTVTDNGNGTYKATLTSPTTVGTATVSATIGSDRITDTATIAFVVGEVSASRSTVAVDKTTVYADGSTKAVIHVKLVDEWEHPLAGKRIILHADQGHSVIVAVNGVTNAHGEAEFTVTDATAEKVIYSAEDEESGIVAAQTVFVTFQALPIPAAPESAAAKTWINGKEAAGVSKKRTEKDGSSTIDILLNADAVARALESMPPNVKGEFTVSVSSDADRTELRIPVSLIRQIKAKASVLILATDLGQYRLPLKEIGDEASDGGLKIAVGKAVGELTSGLTEASSKTGFRLAGAPIVFNVWLDKDEEVSRFNGYVERVIYLPSIGDGQATTVIVWDPKLGARPVPTKFTVIDGHRSAVVRSMTNSVYVPVAVTPTFSDIRSHWARTDIVELAGRMIVNGTDAQRFSPDTAITRAELAALVARALGLPAIQNTSGFSDVAKDSWYSGAVNAVQASGIMGGLKDGIFGPSRIVTRQEAIVTIVRALQFVEGGSSSTTGEPVDLSAYVDGNQVADWAKEAVRAAIGNGLLKGDGNRLLPDKPLTRAETAALLGRMLIKAGLISE
ncbi:invasin domain 3-containing protein [Cohnella soli]|uniref:Invasin domain 3-containing protein n=1 Tax=Cohnella soli TaxID=425005 RepID=A0ABW0HYG0_9BACL